MAQAKTLTDDQIRCAVHYAIENSTQPLRDAAMLLLSFCAGLRAQEIARLEIRDLTDAEGRLLPTIQVTKRAAKYGKIRSVPMKSELFAALQAHIQIQGHTEGPLFFNQHDDPMSPGAVQMQLTRIFARCGLKGASSHSGRRTFLTRAARNASKTGNTLKDVQALAGHANLSTTEDYIDLSDTHRSLIEELYGPDLATFGATTALSRGSVIATGRTSDTHRNPRSLNFRNMAPTRTESSSSSDAGKNGSNYKIAYLFGPADDE